MLDGIKKVVKFTCILTTISTQISEEYKHLPFFLFTSFSFCSAVNNKKKINSILTEKSTSRQRNKLSYKQNRLINNLYITFVLNK